MADDDTTPGVPDPGPEARPEAPVEETPTASHPVVPVETAPAPVLKTRWRDRAWTFRAMLAVAAASLVIGGVVGGVVVAAASHDDGDRGHHRMGPWGPGRGMGPGWQRHGPRTFNGPGGAPGGPMMPYGNGYGQATPAPPATTPTPSPAPSPGATG